MPTDTTTRKWISNLSEDQKQEIIQAYKDGACARVLQERFGFGATTMLRFLRANNTQTRKKTPTYQCNHGFFDQIDSEPKAYWLGFLAADAGISDRKNMITLTLCSRDAPHILRFKQAISATNPLRQVPQVNAVRIDITSPQIVAALALHTVTARKSFTVAWPNLPDEMLRHYARGFVDGNGGFYPLCDRNVIFSVTSNIGLIRDFQKYLMLHCGLKKTAFGVRHQDTPEIVDLKYKGRNQVTAIFELLFSGATIWLPRKREKIEAYFRRQ
jgi:hypothetical protein